MLVEGLQDFAEPVGLERIHVRADPSKQQLLEGFPSWQAVRSAHSARSFSSPRRIRCFLLARGQFQASGLHLAVTRQSECRRAARQRPARMSQSRLRPTPHRLWGRAPAALTAHWHRNQPAFPIPAKPLPCWALLRFCLHSISCLANLCCQAVDGYFAQLHRAGISTARGQPVWSCRRRRQRAHRAEHLLVPACRSAG